jgi:hypothetical protein
MAIPGVGGYDGICSKQNRLSGARCSVATRMPADLVVLDVENTTALYLGEGFRRALKL